MREGVGDREADIQTDKQTGTERQRQTETERDRQAGRQTDRERIAHANAEDIWTKAEEEEKENKNEKKGPEDGRQLLKMKGSELSLQSAIIILLPSPSFPMKSVSVSRLNRRGLTFGTRANHSTTGARLEK